MNVQLFLFLYLVIHIILCILIYLGLRSRVLKFSEQLMPIIVLVPFVGTILAVFADLDSRRRKTGTKPITLEELHLGFEDLRLKKIETDRGGEIVIPLEEAMSVNDAETRRRLMLDILHQKPDEYVRLLQNACLDEDIEVTHYASTAIMEMQREFELSLQAAEREYHSDPDNHELLDRYLYHLWSYIDSGLIDENILFVYRRRYAEMLAKKITLDPDDMQFAFQAVDNYLELSDFGAAAELADRMIARWPGQEKAWFAKMKICQQMNDGVGIKKIISEVVRRNIYLTLEGRNVIAFWSGEYALAEELNL